ncbi:hypothetical protein V1477_007985 [Vespula maculifrons]|uniref:Uncharacterized protein n=1 Tax=Vespula maculifrons TaxID=7453 RepID=A0ABD2CF89_VESMC
MLKLLLFAISQFIYLRTVIRKLIIWDLTLGNKILDLSYSLLYVQYKLYVASQKYSFKDKKHITEFNIKCKLYCIYFHTSYQLFIFMWAHIIKNVTKGHGNTDSLFEV